MSLSTLDLTLGALEVGLALGTFLFGLLTLQCYHYACNNKDGPALRTFVAYIWFMNTLDTGFFWIYFYGISVTNFNNPPGLDELPWSLAICFTIIALITSPIQGFYTYRISVISDNWLMAGLGLFGSLAFFALSTAMAAVAIIEGSVSKFNAHWGGLFAIKLAMEISVDLFITVTMCYYLSPRRAQTKRAKMVLNKLMLCMIETGMATCAAAFLCIIFEIILPKTALWVAVIAILPRLYSNSLLVSYVR
ncbi:hypothetical protein M422DRAFT_252830 [Sphaerobolus stellatus SS14]|uniref:DUF6534 domain-containing protein n=1 Tax=Sphaerobolus stellatus (strain SS14) TaxID=990650 RepID=A0A0C9VPB9_SPHS4|nr:hypothetical protein M422DRAFT_252830 [Sphaerobolus stellatus SS14]